MKKIKTFSIMTLVVIFMAMLSGCSNPNVLKQMEEWGNFSNKYEKAIKQTQIADMIEAHFNNKGNTTKKALLITIDAMCVQSLKYFYDYGKGISAIAKDGGLYWTYPDNAKTKAKIDVGVNFVGIVTGKEPSTIGVLKATDAKREAPLSIMSSLAQTQKVSFLTDNENYINVQLAQEFETNKPNGLTYSAEKDIHSLKDKCLSEIASKKDFIAVATSSPYFSSSQDFNLNNPAYLASIINLNDYINEVYAAIKTQKDEDWLVIVTSTFGGTATLSSNTNKTNVLTFMATNKKF